MRYFETGSKINWVDENNVFLGYDAMEKCCEDFGWVVTQQQPKDSELHNGKKEEKDLSGYTFDRAYVEKLKTPDFWEDGCQDMTFRLVSETKPDLFLTIFNFHEGYYSHGFEVTVGNESLLKGYL